MSERTTIGGVAYETVGSSSSNLLLKCNGTARIQWGSKLIDLIKDGKIAAGSSESKECVFVIDDISQIKSDGVYVLNTDAGSQLLVCKDGEHYNLNGTELYISASNKQDITVDQKQQAIENLGLCYNTLEEAKNAGIKNGFVYILNEANIYTVKNGVFEEFQAKITSVTVEKEQEIGEVINSSIQIVLSIADIEYLVVSNQRILSNYPIYVKDSAQISSETVSDTQGYRLYMDKTEAYIDSDVVTSRHKIITPKVESSNANNTTGFQLYTEGDASYLNIDHINAREWTPFARGMIMMFSGLVSEIPEGWAICDGQSHEYKGVVTVTPNLIGKFIKASESSGATGGSNEITISTSNLPEHSHPHNTHSHSISGTRITFDSSANLNMESSAEFVTDVSFDTAQVSNTSEEAFTEVISSITPTSETAYTTGGVHTHTATIVEGTITESESTEQSQQWENTSINIEPEYYTLIFIIKL